MPHFQKSSAGGSILKNPASFSSLLSMNIHNNRNYCSEPFVSPAFVLPFCNIPLYYYYYYFFLCVQEQKETFNALLSEREFRLVTEVKLSRERFPSNAEAKMCLAVIASTMNIINKGGQFGTGKGEILWEDRLLCE